MSQELEAFVVDIRASDRSSVIGTGFILDSEGLVATCWHVAVAAGIDPSTEGDQLTVGLPRSKEIVMGSVVASSEVNDVAIVRLERALPFGWAPAILGATTGIEGHKFKTKGYSRVGQYTGIRAEGTILGAVESEGKLLTGRAPLQLFSQHIDRGMSGAPVLDIVTDRVVGMVSEVWIPTKERGVKLRDTAFAVPSEVLAASHPSVVISAQAPKRNVVTYAAEIRRLLRLQGYRILERVETEDVLYYKCEALKSGSVVPVIVNVVSNEATPSDKERLRQLMISYEISEGVIVTVPGEE